jgi:hypothetical protein
MRADLLQDFLYLFAALPVAAFGFGFCLHRSFDDLSFLSRAGLAYGFGALVLCVEAILFSWIGLRWGVLALGVPLLVVSAAVGLSFGRRARRSSARSRPTAWIILCWAVCCVSALSCAFFVLSSRAVSVDFLLFYGVKAQRFALSRGIDLDLLRATFFFHGVPQYPPLMPIVEAWGALVAGRLPWRVGALISWIWFVAALTPMAPLLKRRIAAPAAASVTAFWAAALSLSFVASMFGGNGDAPLVFYETMAALLVLVEREWTWSGRWFAGALMAGAVLTKQEGIVAAFLLAVGAWLRDRLERRLSSLRGALPLLILPAAAAALWALYRRFHAIPATIHLQTDLTKMSLSRLPAVVRECLLSMDAGCLGISWIFPTIALVLSWKRLRHALPALVVSGGLLGALVLTYIGYVSTDLHVMVLDTFSRAAQPALSLWILGAGVAWFEDGSVGLRSAEPWIRQNSTPSHPLPD